jgi:hypothetical protein
VQEKSGQSTHVRVCYISGSKKQALNAFCIAGDPRVNVMFIPIGPRPALYVKSLSNCSYMT